MRFPPNNRPIANAQKLIFKRPGDDVTGPQAVEKYRLHERVALGLLLIVGNRRNLLLLAFMLVTALISMWISNTATAALLVHIRNF